MQEPIHNAHEDLDAELRSPTLLESPSRKRDLSDIAGTWVEDRAFDKAIADQHAGSDQ